jgi:hypothetical protein
MLRQAAGASRPKGCDIIVCHGGVDAEGLWCLWCWLAWRLPPGQWRRAESTCRYAGMTGASGWGQVEAAKRRI